MDGIRSLNKGKAKWHYLNGPWSYAQCTYLSDINIHFIYLLQLAFGASHGAIIIANVITTGKGIEKL